LKNNFTATAIFGSRDITKSGRQTIHEGMTEELMEINPDRIYFGGARGSETAALEAAGTIKEKFKIAVTLVGVVPWKVDDQPEESVAAINKYADKVIELEYEKPVGTEADYQKQNQFNIKRANRCRIFWDGKDEKTQRTAELAHEAGLHIRVNLLGEAARDEIRSLAEEQ